MTNRRTALSFGVFRAKPMQDSLPVWLKLPLVHGLILGPEFCVFHFQFADFIIPGL
jgi:hypothetical protein